jgi:hypothetical protein
LEQISTIVHVSLAINRREHCTGEIIHCKARWKKQSGCLYKGMGMDGKANGTKSSIKYHKSSSNTGQIPPHRKTTKFGKTEMVTNSNLLDNKSTFVQIDRSRIFLSAQKQN